MAKTFDELAADRLADEVAVLVTNGYLDSRSAAADALLDYRNPPRSPRSDRLADLERENAELRKIASALVPIPEGATVLSVEIGHDVTTPEEPR